MTPLPIERQVTSLALSRRLRELGVPQESLFYWWVDGQVAHSEQPSYYYVATEGENLPDLDVACAFTVAELGEMLPQYLNFRKGGQNAFLEINHYKDIWSVGYNDLNGSMHFEKDDPEAEARGLMLEYLLANGLLKL